MLKLFKGLKPYWTLVIGVLVLVFISTMTDLELPDLMSDIVDTGIVQGDVSYILGRGGVMLLVALLGTVCTILTSYLSSKIGMGFSRDLRKKVFEKVESFSLTEINIQSLLRLNLIYFFILINLIFFSTNLIIQKKHLLKTSQIL